MGGPTDRPQVRLDSSLPLKREVHSHCSGTADPCPTLSDPLNGAIVCTGPQVTEPEL